MEERIQPSSKERIQLSLKPEKGDLKHNNLKKNKKAEKHCTNEGTNQKHRSQVNGEETGNYLEKNNDSKDDQKP